MFFNTKDVGVWNRAIFLGWGHIYYYEWYASFKEGMIMQQNEQVDQKEM